MIRFRAEPDESSIHAALRKLGFAADTHRLVRLDDMPSDSTLTDTTDVDDQTLYYQLRPPLYDGDRVRLFYAFSLRD